MSVYLRYGRPPSLSELLASSHDSATPADRAYERIKRAILTCELRAGSKLDERALAKKYGVPRASLREAFHHLAMEGLIFPAPRNGYGVAPITVADIRELCEVRKIVESKVASLAAERIRPAQVARLLALAELDYQPGKRETYESYLRANCAFHAQLARTAGNARLETVVLAVLDHLQRPLYLGLDLGLDRDHATGEHLELVDVIRRKRPALAERLLASQLARSEKRMIQACESALA